jgi:hypothetical protein
MAFREMHTYDPAEVSFSFRGLRIGGFAPGTFIEVERDEDGWKKKAGSQGDVTRTRNLNIMGSITVTLMAQSIFNDYLQSIATLDEATGLGTGDSQVMDHNSNMEAHASIAWIRKQPKVERADEAGNTVWVFDCADLEINAGGNVLGL